MELQFESTLEHTDGTLTQFGHEPNNVFVEYYRKSRRLANKSAVPPGGQFEGLVYAAEPRRITSAPVRDFAIKTFPQFGAYGFYTLLYEARSLVIIPINKTQEFTPPPVVSIVDSGTTIDLEISSAESYDCYRIIVRLDYFATEFITYETTFSFIPMYTGECSIYVIGHSEEISIVSQPFETLMTLVDRT